MGFSFFETSFLMWQFSTASVAFATSVISIFQYSNLLFMKKLLVISFALVALQGFAKDDKNTPKDSVSSTNGGNIPSYAVTASALEIYAFNLFDALKLDSLGMEKLTFLHAFQGYQYLLQKGYLRKTNLLTVVDYSQHSSNKRLYVIDVQKRKLVLNTFVAHGKNSGTTFAKNFDTKLDSYKSEIGFLVTAETYIGSAGYSMRFKGVEPKFNGNVRERNIVMHGSDNVTEQFIQQFGMLGRSLGCPAVPENQARKIIDIIKGGSCVFIYHPSETYAKRSKILNSKVQLSDNALLQLPVDAEELEDEAKSPVDLIKPSEY
jgi:hypothetical protein